MHPPPPPPPPSHLYDNNTTAYNHDKGLKSEAKHGYWTPTTNQERVSNAPESSHYNTNLYNMNSTDPYGRENTYSNGLDAGRP